MYVCSTAMRHGANWRIRLNFLHSAHPSPSPKR